MMDHDSLSVVIPLYDEKETVGLLYKRVRETCDSLDRPYEILFVDDGSQDGTLEILRSIHGRDEHVKVISFRRNYGQTAAMSAGFDHARGKVIVSMDGDLQNDPSDIPRLLAKLDEGFDVVCGWRQNRQDKFLTRRVPSLVANWIIGHVTGVRIKDNGCSLKAYRASTIKSVTLYGELHRFIPAMSTLAGARIAEIVVAHHARRYGTSKYGLSRIWKVLADIVTVKMLTGFASRPGLWFGILSFPIATLGVALFLVAIGSFLGRFTEQWLVSSTVGFLLLFLGAHLLSLGIIGELLMRTGDYSPRRTVCPTVELLETENGTDEFNS